MPKIISNPFFIYIIGFGIVLLTYLLRWSDLFPPISASLFIFMIATFVISFFLGVLLQKLKKIEYRPIEWKSNKGTLVVLWIGYALEFAYNGGVPLLMVLAGNRDFNYQTFGIPTFHVILVTFNGFLSVYLFHQLISDFRPRRLITFLLSVAPYILIVSRGAFLITMTSCLFVFLLSLRSIRPRIIFTLSILILGSFYLFGIFGNLRITHGATTTSEYILEISKVTDDFKEAFVADEFIWVYMYVASPMANLQTTINQSKPQDRSFARFIIHEPLPDFIAKRIGNMFNAVRRDVPRVAGWLTVSTFYARSFSSLGWPGMILIFLFFISVNIFYLLALKKSSEYYVTGLAILNTIVLYNTFDNMYAFTGLSFQLIYPLLFRFKLKWRSQSAAPLLPTASEPTKQP